MKKSLNQSGGDWNLMENVSATKMHNGINILEVKIDIEYGGSGRPTKFTVNWKENGVSVPPSQHLN